MDVTHVAKLANLPIEKETEKKLQIQFTETLKTVDTINQADISNIDPTYQVTGLKNVFRQDVIDTSRIIPHDQVISRAKKTYNGYFVVPSILDQSY